MDTTPRTQAETVEQTTRLMRAVAQEFDRAAAECLDGVSISQWHVLAALEGGVGKPMAALGVAALLPGPSLTRLIDGMVDDNLVMRKADVTDRRRMLVFRTRRGTSAYQRICHRLDESGRLAVLLSSNAMLIELLPALLEQLREVDLSSVVGDV